MCYTANAVANYFIKKSLDEKIPLTHMHLQKMMFFAHAFYFKHYGKPLISDPFVAWQHGPVIETLYHDLKKYGNEEITDAEIKHYCEVLAESGTRHLVLDAETLQEVLDHPERLGHYRRLIGGFGLDFRDAHSTWGGTTADSAPATTSRRCFRYLRQGPKPP